MSYSSYLIGTLIAVDIIEQLLEKNLMLKASHNIVHNLRRALHNIDADAFITHLAHAKVTITLKELKRVLRTFIKL